MSPRMLQSLRLALCAALALTVLILPGASVAAGGRAQEQAPSGEPAAGYVGTDTCVACHDGVETRLSPTAHGRAADPRSPAAGRGCESCHGPGRSHAETGDASRIQAFGSAAPREADERCVACHNRGAHAQWAGSMHDRRNVSCVTCHSVHNPQSDTAQLTRPTEAATCGACHPSQVAKVQRVAHMPVREGRMACSSCHNPHGSTNVRLLKVGNWVNESCVSCHTDRRGPFLWEHAAGRESCVSCHDPHGSSHDRMLVAKLPMLCQRCHIGTRHPSTIYDNRVTGSSNRLYGRSCVNCHQNIHGSNHPSGQSFLR